MLAVAVLLFVPAGAIANDPNDVGGKLDLRSVKAVQDGSLLRLTVSTYGPWASRLLRSGNGPSGPRVGLDALADYYDVNGDGKTDYIGRIGYRGGLFVRITGKARHSATSWFARNAPDCQSIASTSVVLPWSTCATIAMLRISARSGTDRAYRAS